MPPRKTKLNRSQAEALGEGYAPHIFHPSFASLHHLPFDGTVASEDEEQGFDEFSEMGNREPNSEGTGRWLVNSKRNTIGILALGKVEAKLLEAVRCTLSAHTGLAVEVLSYKLDLKYSRKDGVSIEDAKRGFVFPIENCPEQKKSRKRNSQRKAPFQPRLEVFSLFDLLVEYVPKKVNKKRDYFAIVALTPLPIGEKVGPKEYVDVLGRACGDRVCVATTVGCSAANPTLVNELIGSVCHEFLHTLGLDHCVEWECLMNSHAADQPWLFLSPLNLRKLELAVYNRTTRKKTTQSKIDWHIVRFQSMLEALDGVFGVQGYCPDDGILMLACGFLEGKIAALKKLRK
jgi:hypothetical protein